MPQDHDLGGKEGVALQPHHILQQAGLLVWGNLEDENSPLRTRDGALGEVLGDADRGVGEP